MRAMLDVAHQGAAMALGMVVLPARKAVVDEQCGAAFEPGTHLARPGFGLQIDLGLVIGQRRHTLCDCTGKVVTRGPLTPDKLITRARHPAFEESAVVRPAETLHRHRVEHFVGQDATGEPTRRLCKPCDTGAPDGQPALLPIAQIRGHFKNMVTSGNAECIKSAKYVRGTLAAACAELKYVQ